MASFNSNNALFFSLLVVISAFMAAPSSVEARIIDLVFIPVASIIGTVYCATSFNVSSNGSTVPPNIPPFPNAAVMLKCGNFIVDDTTTTAAGTFSMAPSIPVGESTCKIIVPTPLARCNVTLPARGSLVSELFSFSSLFLVVGVANISVSDFQLVNGVV